MTDIVAKRRARKEALRPGRSFDDVDHWGMVEVQLAALASGGTARPICQVEHLEEPALDPVVLEKMLRRLGHPEFKGYSGKEIPESEIECDGTEEVGGAPEENISEWLNPGEWEEEEEGAPVKEEERETRPNWGEEEEAERVGSNHEWGDEEEEKEEEITLREKGDEIARLEVELQQLSRERDAANAYIQQKKEREAERKRARIEELQTEVDELKALLGI
jgi:hypothetical protein